MRTARILIVTGDPREQDRLSCLLEAEHYEVIVRETPQQAAAFGQDDIDLVISDIPARGSCDKELLRFFNSQTSRLPFIFLRGSDDDLFEPNSAFPISEMLAKPVDMTQLRQRVHEYVSRNGQGQEVHSKNGLRESTGALRPAPTGQGRDGFENIIGNSPEMLELFRCTRRAAATDTTVLITGESGVGKELIAEAIHRNSPRRNHPFVVVNMAAVPEHLVESELFGHVKGSFTGASESRTGCFEAAHQGTIFIDEIGDFLLQSQSKLLRVLENRTITPVGSNASRTVDVRVVAATSHDLARLTKTNAFRADLYYRLNVINLQLLPLREHRKDIPLLIDKFLKDSCARAHRSLLEITPRLRKYLQAHDWPGNVRQLRNCIESMVVLARGDVLGMEDIPEQLMQDVTDHGQIAIPPGTTLQDLEREAIEQAIEKHHGNRTHAAQALGISVRTLQRKLKVWGRRDQSAARGWHQPG